MVDTSKCFSLIRGRAMRATRLDNCGAKVLGPDSTVVSEGFISVALSPVTDEGTAISVTNAAGRVCVSDTPAPRFTNYNVEASLCGVNPDLVHLLTNQPIVYDEQATPQGVGFRIKSSVTADDGGFALEVWSSVPSGVCEGGDPGYGYFLLPFMKGGILGDLTIANDAVNFTITGARSSDGSAWGVGPYDVTRDNAGAAGPLNTPIEDDDHLHLELVTVAPPTEVCGAVALGVPATGATAGIPATYTPANSYGPLNLAGLSGVTASPGTAWTTGQHVELRDGTTAYWNGTAWVAGIAP